MNLIKRHRKNNIALIVTLVTLFLLFSFTIIKIEQIHSISCINERLMDTSTFFVFNLSIRAENETDADQDGMPDAWELENDLDITRDDSSFDYDFDELENIEEYQNGTDPWNKDTDGDRFNDGFEVDKGTDPTDSNDHPMRVWFYIVIGVVTIGIIACIVWITIITRKDIKKEKKKAPKTKQKNN